MSSIFRLRFRMNSLLVQFKHSSMGAAVKPFDQIFSPKALPIFGHTHLFIPKIGKYSAERFSDEIHAIMKSNNVPIMKLILNGIPLVITLSVDDTRTLFQVEGKYPERTALKALAMIREKNQQSPGVTASNGETWHRLRSGMNPLLKKSLVNAYHDRHQAIAQLHVERIAEKIKRDSKSILRDVTLNCMRFTIDAISVISPVMSISNDAEIEKILNMNIQFMDAMYKTMGEPPVWSLVKTKSYKKLESANNYFYDKISSNVQSLDVSKEPFLKLLFAMDNLSYKDKVILAMDIFVGGIDATATTLAMTLHYLSLDRALQDSIVSELRTPGHQWRLLKACVRETLRMAATAGANGRFTKADTVMSGFRIPKGTLVLSLNPVIGTLDTYFESPLSYRPERWLREPHTKGSNATIKSTQNKLDRSTHNKFDESTRDESTQSKERSTRAFASLPFGFGPRMCPGKVVAEQEMVLYLAQMLKTFIVEPVDQQPLGMIFRTNRVPDRTINIKLTRR